MSGMPVLDPYRLFFSLGTETFPVQYNRFGGMTSDNNDYLSLYQRESKKWIQAYLQFIIARHVLDVLEMTSQRGCFRDDVSDMMV